MMNCHFLSSDVSSLHHSVVLMSCNSCSTVHAPASLSAILLLHCLVDQGKPSAEVLGPSQQFG